MRSKSQKQKSKKEKSSPSTSIGKNFRRSVIWEKSEHDTSINKSTNFMQERIQKKKSSKSRTYPNHLNPKVTYKKERKKALSMMNDAEISKLKFKSKLPERVIRQTLCVFEEFDVTGDGFIRKGELKDVLNATGINASPDQINYIFKWFDKNEDQKISVEEFLNIVKNVVDGEVQCKRTQRMSDVEQDNILCAFIGLGGNPDKSSTISCNKLKNMVDIFDLDLDVDALLKMLDEDENGVVNYQEFEGLFTVRRARESIMQGIESVAKASTSMQQNLV